MQTNSNAKMHIKAMQYELTEMYTLSECRVLLDFTLGKKCSTTKYSTYIGTGKSNLLDQSFSIGEPRFFGFLMDPQRFKNSKCCRTQLIDWLNKSNYACTL